jgi:hypothetical protein
MKTPHEFVFRGAVIPDSTADELARYLSDRITPNEFLLAALSDEFVHAFAAADDENLAAMAVIAAYLYNEVPMAARGSRENVIAWLRNDGEKEPDAV